MSYVPLPSKLERAGRLLQKHRETAAADDCYHAAEVLARTERHIVKLLAYVQKLERRK